ncbi:MAG: site-2 protease family protein [Bacilli bacterium]|nr:site-2 protease family protein [Bacilli bacterium]
MKIKISKTWIFILPVILSMHMQKVMIFIFLLLTLHESMHIICAHFLGYQTIEVCVYPFGLSARIKDFEYKNSIYEIVVTLSGLSVHIIMYFILKWISQQALISINFMEYLNMINIQILCFNLIPLYPLDGGRIIRNVLELLFVYKKAKRISLFLSLLLLLYYIYIGLLKSLSGMIICTFFICQLLWFFYQFKYTTMEFYLYRYLHGSFGKVKMHKQQDIYKNKTNIIIEDGKIKSEHEFLSHYI